MPIFATGVTSLAEKNYAPPATAQYSLGIQHELIDMIQKVLSAIRPELSKSALKLPAAMLYFGMINWTHTWMDPSGPAKPPMIADLAANLFLDGLLKAEVPR